jgi:hypothetical protein
MTPDERAERVLAELDREGLSPASAADAPRIRAVVADAIRAAVADGQEASLSDVSDDALLNELGLRLFGARLRLRAIIADAIHAAVEGERERAAGWLRLAFTAIDRYVPIRDVPDGLDDAREFLAEFRRARDRQGGAGA